MLKQRLRLTESDLHRIVKESVNIVLNKNAFREFLFENLFTHDDNYYLPQKLDDLDITYDFINDYETVLEIDIDNEETRKKVLYLLNMYGWKK